jgi:hypothetical protein
LDVNPYTLEIEPAADSSWLDTATEISIEELFDVEPFTYTNTFACEKKKPKSPEMAEDLMVLITLRSVA